MAAHPESLRPTLFIAAVLLHALALYALANVTMMTPATRIPEVQMQLVKIVVKPPPPPPMPSTMAQMQSLLVGARAPTSAPAPMPIMTSAPTTFKVPLPDLNGTGTAQQLGKLLASTNGAGTETPDIGGLHISPNEILGVLYDNSPSMNAVDDYVQIMIPHYFPGANVVPCDGCPGTYVPGDEITDQTQHDFYFQGDAVAAAPSGKVPKPITALVMVSDWEDGAEDKASRAFVAGLKARHIKLFLLSVERPPYPELVKYATESGGQVSITTEEALTHPPDANDLK